tara:strand:+ start:4015 stop:4233 length:219 start_codon:yes stop_codon:yes gene_type:complete
MSDTIEIQTLDDLIDNLKMMRGAYGNLHLIASSDDEGNSFNDVLFTPTPMIKDTFSNDFEEESDNPTHLCIN